MFIFFRRKTPMSVGLTTAVRNQAQFGDVSANGLRNASTISLGRHIALKRHLSGTKRSLVSRQPTTALCSFCHPKKARRPCRDMRLKL